MTIFPISSISKAFNAANGRFIPSNSRMGSSFPSKRTTKFPFPGFSLLISTSTAAPCSTRYFCIFPARVLNTDHCLHASMERTLPPADAEEEAFLAAAAVDFLGVVDFFALVVLAAFVAFVDVVVPLVFAIVETIVEASRCNDAGCFPFAYVVTRKLVESASWSSTYSKMAGPSKKRTRVFNLSDLTEKKSMLETTTTRYHYENESTLRSLDAPAATTSTSGGGDKHPCSFTLIRQSN
jgi:hypothetical protein